MKNSEYLENAKALVDKGWCKGSSARDKDGNPVSLVVEVDNVRKLSEQAVSFCISGAVYAVTCNGSQYGADDPQFKAYQDCMAILHENAPSGNAVSFNDRDSTQKENVIALFDTAIEQAKVKEQEVGG